MYFYLGPPGRMFALPVIERDGEVPAGRTAPVGTFTSLKGAKSQDRLGPYRGAWELPYVYLGRAEYDLLDALRRGHLGGPLRLIDPQFPNLLPAQIATGGTDESSALGWSTIAGSRRFVRPQSIPLDLLAIGAIEWTKAAAQDELATGRDVSTYRMPTPPNGGPVTVAARMLRADVPAELAILPGIDSWNAAGARTTTLAAARTVAGSWGDVVSTVTPPAGAVEWSPMWRAPAGTAAVLDVAGVRAGHGTTAPGPDRGGGSAEVLIVDLPLTYPSQDEFSFVLKLEEC